jgi:hypothetical protein
MLLAAGLWLKKMILPQSTPDLYLHIRVVISIIVGLCITTLLSGFARFVQHPKRAQVSILHLGWAASLLLWIIHFWWWEFRLTMVQQWTFAIYFFIILYAILYYFLCTLLFPTDLKDYSGYEDYFLSRRRWFFGFLAATFVADVIDTNLKGVAYVHSFGVEYPIRIAANLILCFVAMFSKNRRIQLALLPVSLLYHIYFILRSTVRSEAICPAGRQRTRRKQAIIDVVTPDRDEQLRSQKAGNK